MPRHATLLPSLGLAAAVLGLGVSSADTPPPAARPAAVCWDHLDYKIPAARSVGTQSCAAASCHGGGSPGREGSEHHTWAGGDPHAKAFRVLSNGVSRRIAKNLKRGVPAHQDALCLKCHALDAPQLVRVADLAVGAEAWPSQEQPRGGWGAAVLANGVGCESCHGPGEKYLTEHYSDAWKSLSVRDKAERYGLFPTKDLAYRVTLCAGCHVGNQYQEVNHDLIAAGHPRLAFEYSGFHHSPNYPKHWTEKNYGPDFDVRAWQIGQIGSARAAVGLLEARARRAAECPEPAKVPWPELAEFSCYGCHQDLPGKGWRTVSEPRHKPGVAAWQPWYAPLAAAVADPKRLGIEAGDALPEFAALPDYVEAKTGDPKAVAAKAHRAFCELDGRLKRLQASADADSKARPYGPDVPAELVRRLFADSLTADGAKFDDVDWDGATQRYLGASALYYGWSVLDRDGRDPRYREPLLDLRRSLTFPRGYDSPKDATPAGVLGRFQTLRTLAPDAPRSRP